MYVWSNIGARSCNHCCGIKAIIVTHSECVFVAFGNQHPMPMRHTTLCLWPDRLYNIFPYYLINETIFEKKLLYIKCAFWFFLQYLLEIFLILRRSEGDMIKKVHWSSCKAPVILVRFNETFPIFSTDFRTILKCQISLKPIWSRVVPRGQTDGQT